MWGKELGVLGCTLGLFALKFPLTSHTSMFFQCHNCPQLIGNSIQLFVWRAGRGKHDDNGGKTLLHTLNLWGCLHSRKGLCTTQSFLRLTLNFFPPFASSVWKQPIFSLRESRRGLAGVSCWFLAISVYTGCVSMAFPEILTSVFMCPSWICSSGNCCVCSSSGWRCTAKCSCRKRRGKGKGTLKCCEKRQFKDIKTVWKELAGAGVRKLMTNCSPSSSLTLWLCCDSSANN